MKHGNRESGSSAFVIVASMGSLALAFIFSQNAANRTKQAVDQSKVARAIEEKHAGSMSALSHYKSLITPKKIDATWIPALYAENYFDRNWSMRTYGKAGAKFTQKSAQETKIDLRESSIAEKDLTAIMMAAKASKLENYTVKFLKPNFDTAERLVQSVDIEVTGRTKVDKVVEETVKVTARVPLPAPTPYNPRLMFRKPGAGAWTAMTQDADLTDGPYEFIAEVSGIAFDADLLIDGASLSNKPIFGGRDGSGRVNHEAVNYENVGGKVGPAFAYDPAPEPDPEPEVITQEPPASGGGGGGGLGAPSTSDGTSCGFVSGSWGGAGSGGGGGTAPPPMAPPPIPPAPSLPLTGTFQLVVRGPDGNIADSSKTEVFKVNIRKPPPPPKIIASPGGGGGGDTSPTDGRTLTADDYRNRCTAECPYIGEKATGDDIGGHAAYVSAGPVSAMHTFVEGQQRWGIMTQKVCFKFPGGPRVAYDIHDSEVWAFDPNTCAPTRLFRRGACGCLTGDTLILLGDGKTEKRIDQMTANDLVWNPMTKKAYPVRKFTSGPETKPLIDIALSGESIRATTEHPFPTDKGLKQAQELQVGDKIRMNDGKFAAVTEIRQIPVPSTPPVVWNLELEGADDDLNNHYVVANGIVTGDLLIQMRLKKQVGISQTTGSRLD